MERNLVEIHDKVTTAMAVLVIACKSLPEDCVVRDLVQFSLPRLSDAETEITRLLEELGFN